MDRLFLKYNIYQIFLYNLRKLMTFASRFFGSHCVGSVHIFWTFFLSLCHPVKPSTSGHKKCKTNATHKTNCFSDSSVSPQNNIHVPMKTCFSNQTLFDSQNISNNVSCFGVMQTIYRVSAKPFCFMFLVSYFLRQFALGFRFFLSCDSGW